MLNRKGLAAITAAGAGVLLCCANFAGATELPSPDALSLTPQQQQQQAQYLQNTAPRKPLMNLLDRMGAASTLDSYGLNVGGFIEMSWTHNFDDPTGDVNVARVFDFEHDDHTFNQADIFIERLIAPTGERFDWGGRIEWIWGGDARLIHANGVFDHYGFPLFPGSPGTGDGPDEQFDPVQFYIDLNFPVGNGLMVRAGKFVTLLGYETINPTTNPLYSHSFSFGFAIPFTNTGVLGIYQIDKNWSVTGGIIRGWDQSFEDNNEAHSYTGQIKYTTENLDLIVNGIMGPEQLDNSRDYRYVLELIGVYRQDAWTLAIDALWGHEQNGGLGGADGDWYGAAGYAIFKVNDMLSAVGRLEFFSDDDGARFLDTQLVGVTAGLNIKPCPTNEWGSGLMIRPEIRWDWANDDIFDGGGDDSQLTIGGDIIYAF